MIQSKQLFWNVRPRAAVLVHEGRCGSTREMAGRCSEQRWSHKWKSGHERP